MARVTGEIIDRPVDVVLDVVADERNEPNYNPDLLPAEKLTDHRRHTHRQLATEVSVRR